MTKFERTRIFPHFLTSNQIPGSKCISKFRRPHDFYSIIKIYKFSSGITFMVVKVYSDMVVALKVSKPIKRQTHQNMYKIFEEHIWANSSPVINRKRLREPTEISNAIINSQFLADTNRIYKTVMSHKQTHEKHNIFVGLLDFFFSDFIPWNQNRNISFEIFLHWYLSLRSIKWIPLLFVQCCSE